MHHREVAVTATYVAANNEQRVRLISLVDSLSDTDLERRLPSGIRIADVLVHLAFWDTYTCDVLRQWRDSGFTTSVTNFEALNAAILMLSATIPGPTAVAMVRAAAQSVDAEAEMVGPELAQLAIQNGKLRSLERAQHRREHIDQLLRVLEAS